MAFGDQNDGICIDQQLGFGFDVNGVHVETLLKELTTRNMVDLFVCIQIDRK